MPKHHAILVAILTGAAAAATGCRSDLPEGAAAPHAASAERLEAPMDEVPRLALPPRAADAPTGTEFLRRIESLSLEEREEAVYREIKAGNVPDFLRRMKPVQLYLGDARTSVDASRSAQRATIWVIPDYLAIGSDRDFVRMPMNLITASRLARDLGCVLPTKKIVDAIYAQSSVRTTPQPLPAGPEMTSAAYYLRHNEMINAALGRIPLGELVAGHKKDVVISNKLLVHPGRIIIYGWHQQDGVPIQPLSDAHDVRYADYSHGIRLVAETVWVNGAKTTLQAAVADTHVASLFTYEGKIERYGEFMDSARMLARD